MLPEQPTKAADWAKRRRWVKFVFPLSIICLIQLALPITAQSRDTTHYANLAESLIAEKIPLIETLAKDPVLIKALKNRDKKLMSLDQILRKDHDWLATPIDKREGFAFPEKSANQLLQTVQAKHSMISEVIVTDANGATAYSSPMPSDFWQGDEAKFIQPALTHNIYCGPIEFDASSSVYQVQIAVPVFAPGDEKLIGVIIGGIELPLESLLDLNVGSPGNQQAQKGGATQ